MLYTSQTFGDLFEVFEGLNHKTIRHPFAANVSQKTRNSSKMHVFEPQTDLSNFKKLLFQFSGCKEKTYPKTENKVLMANIMQIPQDAGLFKKNTPTNKKLR